MVSNVKQRSYREIRMLLMSLLCLWGGITLVGKAIKAGPDGQVVRQSKSDHLYTTSAKRVMAEGVVLTLVGVGGAFYSLRRFRLY